MVVLELLCKAVLLPVFIVSKFISIVFFTAHSDEMPTVIEWLGLEELA